MRASIRDEKSSRGESSEETVIVTFAEKKYHRNKVTAAGVTSRSVPPRNVSPHTQQCFARAILHPVLIGTVLLHHSLGFWTVYQRFLLSRPSYSYKEELSNYYTLQYIHVTRNLCALLHGWGTHLGWGTDIDVTPHFTSRPSYIIWSLVGLNYAVHFVKCVSVYHL